MTDNSEDRFNGVLASLALKAPCVAVATTNITLSGEQTVGGVAVVSGDRVLVMGQTDATKNGIYKASSSAWARAADFDGNRDLVKGTLVPVALSIDGDMPIFKVTTSDPIIIDTSSINFSRYNGHSVVTVGDKDTSIDARTSVQTVVFDTTLTANRTVTLVTAGALEGDRVRVVRTGLGAFTLDVGGLKTIASATAAFVDVEFDGSAWILTGYGAL